MAIAPLSLIIDVPAPNMVMNRGMNCKKPRVASTIPLWHSLFTALVAQCEYMSPPSTRSPRHILGFTRNIITSPLVPSSLPATMQAIFWHTQDSSLVHLYNGSIYVPPHSSTWLSLNACSMATLFMGTWCLKRVNHSKVRHASNHTTCFWLTHSLVAHSVLYY